MFSSRTFLTRFHEYSRRRRLIGEQSKIIVAVSGGVDSTVLLDLLKQERDALGLSLIVAHFNHQLRGSESDADEQFVMHRTKQYGLEVYIDRANTAEYARHAHLGLQEAARNLRYDFFSKLLESSGYDLVATAHNADDNTETILLNLFRGAGVQGLAGIPVLRQDKKIIRPLLFARREEIEAYATAEQIPYRTDSSNAKDTYTRNFIRHQVLPLIREQVNPNIAETLQRTSELFRELEGYLLHTARAALDVVAISAGIDEMALAIPRLKSHPVLIQQYIVMLAAQRVAGCRPEYEQVSRILELTEGLTGSWVMLSDRHGVYRDRDLLVLRPMEEPADFRIIVLQNHRYQFKDFRFASEHAEQNGWQFQGGGAVEYVDADQIPPGHLVLRTWEEGDWFVPLGMKTRKKISDYFVDAKIPLYEKRKFPILATKEGEIIWVCGQRIDDHFKVTEKTLHVLKLEFQRTPNGTSSKDDQGQRGSV
jgi:tRNA(Ile)-lysidine synthase